MNEWQGFKTGRWESFIDVSDFVDNNYTEYLGDESFLENTTSKTDKVWAECMNLYKQERIKGVLAVETGVMSGIDNYDAGYINEYDDVIVGLQTDSALKRIVNPYGGIRMVNMCLDAYDIPPNDILMNTFSEYRKSHNDGVFDVYNEQIRAARRSGLITGLPDAYGRGRIIGDYRRVALYGIDRLISSKTDEWKNDYQHIDEKNIRIREELAEQVKALKLIKKMANRYGYDISMPAKNAKEAIQWTYFAFLAAVKENNGAAMSLGRVSTFLDIYIQRDIDNGIIDEKTAQEYMDHFIIKLRLVRHLRTPDYDEIFCGDPTWVTESIAGMLDDSRSLVTKNSYRTLHTLVNIGSSPEPNLTVLWSKGLPESFKRYCAKISILTDAVQYENDDIMRPIYGHDYGIACCVSAMKIGEQMQYFGARCNIAKALLYAINGGVDEIHGDKIIDGIDAIDDEILDYDKVMNNYRLVLSKVSGIYVDAMNIIHYMHDKYAYERGQMALHDTDVERLMAFGIAGFSVAADSLSAIKYAKVKVVRENGLAVDFVTEGEYPLYGNDDDRVDDIASSITEYFYNELSKHELYRDAVHTLSILTITSNVMYGMKTGSTPDGRKRGEPFAPGANPMHGRDSHGALASLNSVAKIDYSKYCRDGISNTFSIVPNALGKDDISRISNLVSILDGYFAKNAHHINVNVLNRDMLIDAMNNPDKYPTLTIRVSGYAVNFNRLSRAHQQEVIDRTFHNYV